MKFFNEVKLHKINIIVVTILVFIIFGINFLSSSLVASGAEDSTSEHVKTHYSGGFLLGPGILPSEFDIETLVPINILINSPLPPSVKKYSPGEIFNFQADFTVNACGNAMLIANLDTIELDTWSQWG